MPAHRHEHRGVVVLATQQASVLGLVAAVALSAVGVVELEIVPPAAPPRAGAGTSLVSAAPVTPTVRTVGLSGDAVRTRSWVTGLSRFDRRSGGADGVAQRIRVVSTPQPATGYATVGITWAEGTAPSGDALEVEVRTARGGVWSPWQELELDADHAPDPGSPEAGRVMRDGTDAVVVGVVDDVQVRATSTTGELPDDLALAVVDPGEAEPASYQDPAIDTGALPAPEAATVVASTGSQQAAGTPAEVTPQPQIFSRAQWGADERLREPSSLHYGTVQAAFVHHTVNANDYTREQVPAILRGIYAYHTQSRGWSDIGYNFLVDRFGRIWEGRYGGVDRPVVGAHTSGYNDEAFAMSAIGNFETARPSEAVIDAFAALMAWKLSLHGISAADERQQVAGTTFRAINGHSEADQTACPGRYLFARLPDIRTRAAALQRPFDSRARTADLGGQPWPDLVVRDRRTQRALVVRTGGQLAWLAGLTARTGWEDRDLVAAPGDLTGDGVADLLARSEATGTTELFPGSGSGPVLDPVRSFGRFAGDDQLTAVGDWDGDGRPDLVGRRAADGTLVLYRGSGNGGFGSAEPLASGWGADLTVGAGDLDGDGRPDLLARNGDTLTLVRGTTTGLGDRVTVPGSWGRFDLLSGRGDATGDGLPDLVARERASRLTYVYPGDGAGGFGPRIGGWSRYAGLRWLALAGQLDGTGRPDLAGVGANGQLRVFPHSGRRNLGRVVDTGIDLAAVNLLVNVGDWNGDGQGDFMAREAGTGVMRLYPGLGRSRFGPPVVAGRGWQGVGLVAAQGDVTGDGFPDLMARDADGRLRVHPSNGAGGFAASFVALAAVSADRQLGLGLWDGDGAPDTALRRTDGSLEIWSGNGPGGLVAGRRALGDVDGYDWLKGLGDVDGDRRADVVGRERGTGDLWLLPGRKDGFGPRRLIGTGFDAYDLAG